MGAGMDGSTSAVIFDLDGTLIATRSLYLECYRRALEPELGRRPSDEELFGMKPRAELRFLPELAAEADACLETFYRHYESLHDTLFEGVYRGVPEMLETLRMRDVPLGIVTGKSRRGLEITAARVELGPFDAVVVDDDVAEPKPDPEGLRRALDALGAVPADAVYVGDTIGDMRAARAAGVRGGAVVWSKRAYERDGFIERARAEGAVPLIEPADVMRLAASSD
ncbi:MAG: HAD family hydrolase [Gemmatimonadota bacterium]